jgi:hypothetical protein
VVGVMMFSPVVGKSGWVYLRLFRFEVNHPLPQVVLTGRQGAGVPMEKISRRRIGWLGVQMDAALRCNAGS